jgi:outer membrane biogenesis lipoprotein LolB
MRLIALFLILTAGCLTGCKAPSSATFEQHQQALRDNLSALKEARFKGRFRFNAGGNLLGVNAKTNWSFGPENMNIDIEGDVDFTDYPAAAP